MHVNEEVERFFDEFVEVFPTFDGKQIARRYAAPYLAVRAAGSVALFSSSDAIADYFQEIVNGYRDRGCTRCRYSDLRVHQMGASAVLGTVTWEIVSEAGAVLSSWRESYTLVRLDGGLRVRSSVDHAS